ncbi:MAG: GNAT family N-acetyltransferase [Cyanobacteria bacterium P01_A01_bin.114]
MVPNLKPQTTVRWVNRLTDLPQAEWDAIAKTFKTPFFEWAWLHNMESSGSAVANAGWLPNHLTVWRDRTLIAAAPLYLKGHSYGEFIFDHQWAELAERLGVQYYPKLLGMSPFTPAEGYRFLIAEGEDEADLTKLMVSAIDDFCLQNNISGCNFLYVDPDWRAQLEQLGFRTWLHHSYVWQNQGYQTFNDYLGQFNANQRRNIKRERKSVEKAGLRFEVHTGTGLDKALCSKVYDFYSDTCDKFGWWGSKYLTRKFFQQLYPTYCDRTVVFAAYLEHDADPVGMSFCLTKGDRLYGRYWGSFEDFNHLHFNACYYEPIDWAIQNGIQIFDPGAGGRHKKRRGFPAAPNYSLHRFYEPSLQKILNDYIDRINRAEQRDIELINADLPLKQSQPSCGKDSEK